MALPDIPRDKEKAKDHTRRIEVREASSDEIESDTSGQEALMQPDAQDKDRDQGIQQETKQEKQERSQQNEPA